MQFGRTEVSGVLLVEEQERLGSTDDNRQFGLEIPWLEDFGMQATTQREGSVRPLVVAVIVVLLAVSAALYLSMRESGKPSSGPQQTGAPR